jgi:hypothetical protein
MIIRNKFNGYGFDGARLYHDPVSLSLAAGAAGTAAAGTAATAGAAAAATGAGAALGSGLATGAALGSGLTASAGLLAPTLGAGLGAAGAGLGGAGLGAGLGAAGAGLGGAGLGAGLGATGLTAAGGMLAPSLGAGLGATGAGLGGAGLAGLGGAGLQAAGSMLAPGLGASLPTSALASSALPAAASTLPTAASSMVPQASQSVSPMVQGDIYTKLTGAPMATPQMTPVGAAPVTPSSSVVPGANAFTNIQNLVRDPSMQGLKDYAVEHPYVTSSLVSVAAKKLFGDDEEPKKTDVGMIRPYEFTRTQRPEAYGVSPLSDTSERLYFDDQFVAQKPYAANSKEAKKAEGGIASSYAVGGPVEQMAALNAVGANTGYPMAGINTPLYANPMVQRPEATSVIAPTADAGVGTYTGEPRFADGGIANLGGYSDGGRLLKGPGDGVSDSIPAVIGKRQPARLADGEFVIPARIVSELGNGSTDAGARKLYKMMDRIQKGRSKSVGKNKVAVDSKSDKHLPA